MNFFLLQSIFLLLLCFVVGYVIARFIKRRIYRRATLKSGSTVSDNESLEPPAATATQKVSES